MSGESMVSVAGSGVRVMVVGCRQQRVSDWCEMSCETAAL